MFSDKSIKTFNTACPRNCYSTCSMKVFVEDGRLKMIEANPDNKAVSEGVCLKGLSYVERVHSPDRILYPLKRNLTTGKFEKISWDAALEIIAEKLNFFKSEFAPQSIMFYNGSGTKGLLNSVSMSFWRLFGGCTTTYGDLCWPAGLEATRLTLGENKHNAPWDLENAKSIILWGKNSAETNIHQMPFAEKAIENGAELIVIDPRRTQTAERAHLLIQPRPGTDGALALAAAHLIIKNNWIDDKFVDKFVLGFDEYKELVESFTPEKAAYICDIPVEYVIKLAESIGTIKPVTIAAGFGMQRYTNSGQTMRAMIALLALTGNIGIRGAGWQFANLQSAVFDEVKDPVAFYPPEKPDGIVRVSISTTRLGRDMLNIMNPELKMIWVERGNPVTQNPETHKVLQAFNKLDFKVVVDQFLTDTARVADIILPAKTMFEQSDIIGAYWHPYIQLKQKIIEPPGEVKPESEIYYLLAKKMGMEEDEIKKNIPGPKERDIENYLNIKLKEFTGVTIEKLKESPIIANGHQEIAFSDFVFPTPSGKIELLSKEAEDRWGLDTLPDYKEPCESIKNNSLAQKYPLNFLTPNTKNRIHSQFNNLKLIEQVSPKPELYLNPLDAEKRNIAQGDKVKLFNERGELYFTVSLDFSIKAGCVSVTNGWWITQGGTVNFLSEGRETDMGFGAAFHDNLVEVIKI